MDALIDCFGDEFADVAKRLFDECVVSDQFPVAGGWPYDSATSIIRFVDQLQRAGGKHFENGAPIELQLDLKIREILEWRIIGPFGDIEVALLLVDFISRSVPSLLSTAAQRLISSAPEWARDDLTEELAGRIIAAVSSETCMYDLATQMAKRYALVAGPSVIGDRLLFEAGDDGFVWEWDDEEDWFPWEGERLPPIVVEAECGRLVVDIEIISADEGVSLALWYSRLESEDGERVIARAGGSSYILPRLEGRVSCSSSAIRWAADAASDVDVSQVIGFQESVSDYERIISKGDFSFLRIWERSSHADPGLGAEMLDATMRALRRRFPALQTILIDVEPFQFYIRQDRYQPLLCEERGKNLAIGKIKRYIDARFGAQMDVRYFEVPPVGGDGALAVLGAMDSLYR